MGALSLSVGMEGFVRSPLTFTPKFAGRGFSRPEC